MGREKYSYWTEEEDRTLKEVFSQYVPDKERVEKKLVALLPNHTRSAIRVRIWGMGLQYRWWKPEKEPSPEHQKEAWEMAERIIKKIPFNTIVFKAWIQRGFYTLDKSHAYEDALQIARIALFERCLKIIEEGAEMPTISYFTDVIRHGITNALMTGRSVDYGSHYNRSRSEGSDKEPDVVRDLPSEVIPSRRPSPEDECRIRQDLRVFYDSLSEKQKQRFEKLVKRNGISMKDNFTRKQRWFKELRAAFIETLFDDDHDLKKALASA